MSAGVSMKWTQGSPVGEAQGSLLLRFQEGLSVRPLNPPTKDPGFEPLMSGEELKASVCKMPYPYLVLSDSHLDLL